MYEANVTSDSENMKKKYIGLTEGTFKKRFYGRQLFFKDRKYLINGTKRYNLCFSEKLCILKANKSNVLNKRSELISKCRHRNKFYIKNYKGKSRELMLLSINYTYFLEYVLAVW